MSYNHDLLSTHEVTFPTWSFMTSHDSTDEESGLHSDEFARGATTLFNLILRGLLGSSHLLSRFIFRNC